MFQSLSKGFGNNLGYFAIVILSAFFIAGWISTQGSACAPLVRRLGGFGCSESFSNSVSRQSGTLSYLMQRELVAEVHHYRIGTTIGSKAACFKAS